MRSSRIRAMMNTIMQTNVTANGTAKPANLAVPNSEGSASAVDGVPFLSVVLPVFNEQNCLTPLYDRLLAVIREFQWSYEVVFVDDGSGDRSYEILQSLHDRDPHVRVIQFSRNFGHHLAVTAGIDEARGQVVVLMDSDLQDRPEEIPTLIAKLNQGYDVVYGVRRHKQHSMLKKALSWGFFWLLGRAGTQVELNSGIFRVARRNVIDTVKECRETNRFVVGLMSWVGFRQIGVEVEHGARHAGETKYSLSRQLRLALDTVTAFSDFPLRWIAYLGLFVSASSFIFASVIVARKLIWNFGVVGWPSLMVIVLFLGGIQLLSLGMIGQYLSRVLSESRQRPLYVIAQRLERAALAHETHEATTRAESEIRT